MRISPGSWRVTSLCSWCFFLATKVTEENTLSQFLISWWPTLPQKETKHRPVFWAEFLQDVQCLILEPTNVRSYMAKGAWSVSLWLQIFNREISLDYPGEPKKSHELLRSKELSPAGVRVLQQRKRQERRGYGFTQWWGLQLLLLALEMGGGGHSQGVWLFSRMTPAWQLTRT